MSNQIKFDHLDGKFAAMLDKMKLTQKEFEQVICLKPESIRVSIFRARKKAEENPDSGKPEFPSNLVQIMQVYDYLEAKGWLNTGNPLQDISTADLMAELQRRIDNK